LPVYIKNIFIQKNAFSLEGKVKAPPSYKSARRGNPLKPKYVMEDQHAV